MKNSFTSQFLLENDLLKGTVLVFGAGLEKEVEVLQKSNVPVTVFEHNCPDKLLEPDFDTIVCSIFPDYKNSSSPDEILFKVSLLLKPGGKAYFHVRDKGQQLFFPCKPILRNGELKMFEYQHYSFLNRGNDEVSPFFGDNEFKLQAGEITTAFAIRDKFPVSPGHALIIPKRKAANYFTLPLEEQNACWFLINLVQKQLQEEFNPSGFNIGVNVNEAAGQTVPHCHIHLIPRYDGDVEIPRGGVRGVIPNKKEY